MNRCLPFAITLASALPAQLPPDAVEFDAVERAWPAAFAGVDGDLACGGFVAGHPGRGVVVVRGGGLYLAWDPARFEHFHATSFTGAGAVVTLPSVDAGPDLLAVSTAAGLRVLRFAAPEFVDAVPAQGALAGWAGARDLEFGVNALAGVPTRSVLAHASGWVRAAVVDDDGTVWPPLVVPAPPGQGILDADFVDWLPGGMPEIAVLTTTGTYVVDASGVVVFARAMPSSAGVLEPMPAGGEARFVQLRDVGGVWQFETVCITAGGPQVRADGVLDLEPPVRGIAIADLDGDVHVDVVVSTGESVRRVLFGSPTGFGTDPEERLDFVDTDDLPPNPLPNGAALAIDDLDRDGRVDFVIAQRPTDRLVVVRGAKKQVLEEFGVVGFEGPTKTVQFEAGLGYADTMTGGIDDPEQHGAFGLRLRLPGALPAAPALDAIVYQVHAAATGPSAGDLAKLAAIAHYRYPLVPGDAGKAFDLLLPLHHSVVAPNQAAPIPRFVVEFCLVEADALKPLQGTEPLFVECAVSNGVEWGQFVLALAPDPALLWWVLGLIWDPFVWSAGQTPPTGGDPAEVPIDARYVGAFEVLIEPQVEDAPSVPVDKLGNGVAH